MNFKFYPLRALLLALLLLGFKARTQAQAVLQFTKSVANPSVGGDGTTAAINNILVYTITVKNLTSQNFVAAKVYDNVPSGVSYIAGSTTLNGVAVPDNSGAMPYSGSGSLVNSPTFGPGILAPNNVATIIFQVKVTANGGQVFNNATIDATQNAVSTIQATNTVITAITVDAACNKVYQVTDLSAGGGTYSYLREVNTNNGTGGAAKAIGPSPGTIQADALTHAWIRRTSDPKQGRNDNFERTQLLDGCAAIAYDQDSNRIYFVNNTTDRPPLCYYDMNRDTIFRFTGSYLEPTQQSNWNVNRMGKGSDGNFYALTSNAKDLIKFWITAGNVLHVKQMGALTNASVNGSNNDVQDEGGGDLFADGSGKLYLIVNSSKMYKINPATLVATYMGKINFNSGGTFTSQSLAIDANGVVYINGAYQNVYTLDLQTMQTTKINSGSTNVYESGDYTACGFPALASSIIADKTFSDIDGDGIINGGDTVEYKITVTNIGNINAAGVYMYDYIPPSTTYIPNTTKLNGVSVADKNGAMPFAVTGSPNGKLVNTAGEDPGIVLPTPANAAVVTFRVKTEPDKQVCNQSKISLLDADGNVMFVNSSDPTNLGQTPTCFYSDGLLPLANLKLKGTLQDDKSLLNWSMTGDQGVDYYDIEYSSNNSAFGSIGKVPAKGNANMVNSYTFTDADHAFATSRWYRLKVVQKGGSINYSPSILLSLNAKDMDIMAAPNPFDGEINVRFQLKTTEQVSTRLVDFAGREIYSKTETMSIGSQTLKINIPGTLAKGMYTLYVNAGKKLVYQKKLLKQ
jgi:uncharacterized repeat protein (TIGR01451 family)